MLITTKTGLARRRDQAVPLLDDPPIGHLQAIVAKKIGELGSDAYGFKVLEELSLETGVWIDHSQIYSSIRKLLDKEFVEHHETRAQKGAPPLKLYRLTVAGRAALKATAAHHKAVAVFLDNNKR